MTVTALSSVTAPSVASVQHAPQAHRIAFGHSDEKKDSVDLNKSSSDAPSADNKPYTFMNYLWKPGSGFGHIIGNLVVPNRTLAADIFWGMALPPFTLIFPVVGIIRAIKKASDAKKLANIDTSNVATTSAPDTKAEPLPVVTDKADTDNHSDDTSTPVTDEAKSDETKS